MTNPNCAFEMFDAPYYSSSKRTLGSMVCVATPRTWEYWDTFLWGDWFWAVHPCRATSQVLRGYRHEQIDPYHIESRALLSVPKRLRRPRLSIVCLQLPETCLLLWRALSNPRSIQILLVVQIDASGGQLRVSVARESLPSRKRTLCSKVLGAYFAREWKNCKSHWNRCKSPSVQLSYWRSLIIASQ